MRASDVELLRLEALARDDWEARDVVDRLLGVELGALPAGPVEDVDPEKVSAAFKNGVLTVTMSKLPQAESKVKRIAINAK